MLLLGPLGLVTGALLGGNKNSVTFVLTLDDGRTAVATSDHATYTALLGVQLQIKRTHLRRSSRERGRVTSIWAKSWCETAASRHYYLPWREPRSRHPVLLAAFDGPRDSFGCQAAGRPDSDSPPRPPSARLSVLGRPNPG